MLGYFSISGFQAFRLRNGRLADSPWNVFSGVSTCVFSRLLNNVYKIQLLTALRTIPHEDWLCPGFDRRPEPRPAT